MKDSRERVRRALRHEAGPVPIDFGSTAITGMHVSCVAALRDHYGLERRLVKVCEPYQMLGEIEEDLAGVLGIDVAGVGSRNTMFGFPNENWKIARMPWGQEVLVSEHFRTTPDGRGGLFIHPQGDLSAPPSGHMPARSFFFDTVIRQAPIDDNHLNPEDNLEEFAPLPEAEIERYARTVNEKAATGRAVIIGLSGTGLGDIALVPGPFLKRPRGIRDVQEWYLSLAARRDYVAAIFERQTEIALENLRRVAAAVDRDAIDAIILCGTDFGMQRGTFCSVDDFHSLFLPFYRRMTDWIHAHTPWKIMKHSCGAVASLIPSLLDAGFDILNPVQCSAEGMAPEALKKQFGGRIVFWGGGVDTQRTLPFGTPQQVREEVLRRCEVFSENGGFIFNSIHNVQARTPVENIAAMIEAVREFNGER